MGKTNIQWTWKINPDGSITKGETWNPITGCSKVSPGCAHCYAETLSLRWGWSTKPWLPVHAAENIVLHPNRLSIPLHWRKPRRIFVNSMSDLFHEQVPDEFIDQIFRMMLKADRHIYQILTKRPERMQEYIKRALWRREATWLAETDWMPENIWLGVSVENQHWADIRIPLLLQTPAAVQFLSCEPLLGPLDLMPYLSLGIAWLIVGGESGPRFRPMDLDWARSLREQCSATETAFYFKQVGGRTSKSGGILLDGQQWHQMPV